MARYTEIRQRSLISLDMCKSSTLLYQYQYGNVITMAQTKNRNFIVFSKAYRTASKWIFRTNKRQLNFSYKWKKARAAYNISSSGVRSSSVAFLFFALVTSSPVTPYFHDARPPPHLHPAAQNTIPHNYRFVQNHHKFILFFIRPGFLHRQSECAVNKAVYILLYVLVLWY